MKYLYLSIILLNLFGCQNSSNDLKEKELKLKEKELELKERELNLKEDYRVTDSIKISKSIKKERQLIHLIATNAGMCGYFDDGTYVNCPRCDLFRSNILNMFKKSPDGTWDTTDKTFMFENEEDWALINYVWKQKPIQN